MNKSKVFKAISNFVEECELSYLKFIVNKGNFKYLTINESAVRLKQVLCKSGLTLIEAKYFDTYINSFVQLLSSQLTETITSGPSKKIEFFMRKFIVEGRIRSLNVFEDPAVTGALLSFQELVFKIYRLIIINRGEIISCDEKSKPIIEILEKRFVAKEFIPSMDELSVRLKNVSELIDEDSLNMAIVLSFGKLAGKLVEPMIATYGLNAMSTLMVLGNDELTKDFNGTIESISPAFKQLISSVVGSENVDSVLKSGVELYNTYKPLTEKITFLQSTTTSCLEFRIETEKESFVRRAQPFIDFLNSRADMNTVLE